MRRLRRGDVSQSPPSLVRVPARTFDMRYYRNEIKEMPTTLTEILLAQRATPREIEIAQKIEEASTAALSSYFHLEGVELFAVITGMIFKEADGPDWEFQAGVKPPFEIDGFDVILLPDTCQLALFVEKETKGSLGHPRLYMPLSLRTLERKLGERRPYEETRRLVLQALEEIVASK